MRRATWTMSGQPPPVDGLRITESDGCVLEFVIESHGMAMVTADGDENIERNILIVLQNKGQQFHSGECIWQSSSLVYIRTHLIIDGVRIGMKGRIVISTNYISRTICHFRVFAANCWLFAERCSENQSINFCEYKWNYGVDDRSAVTHIPLNVFANKWHRTSHDFFCSSVPCHFSIVDSFLVQTRKTQWNGRENWMQKHTHTHTITGEIVFKLWRHGTMGARWHGNAYVQSTIMVYASASLFVESTTNT